MPYYRGPRFQATTSLPDKTDKLHIQTLLTNNIVHQGASDIWAII
jgi:hypothetical protein